MNNKDKNIKSIEENDTVGIVICKQDIEYVLNISLMIGLLLGNMN